MSVLDGNMESILFFIICYTKNVATVTVGLQYLFFVVVVVFCFVLFCFVFLQKDSI